MGGFWENSYLIPLIFSVLCIIWFAAVNVRRYKISVLTLVKRRSFSGTFSRLIRNVIPEGSRAYKYYSRLLRYSRLTISTLFKVKLGLFLSVLAVCFLIKFTNINIQTRQIYGTFDYRTDLLYTQKDIKDRTEAFKQEMRFFRAALENIEKSSLLHGYSDDIQQLIRDMITVNDNELLLSRHTMANKIYNRLVDYYHVREMNILAYLLLSIAVSFLPELVLYIKNLLSKADARQELRLLKKIIIMNGNIKPVDFMSVLRCLIEKSRYYKPMLEEIEDKNKRNSINRREIYSNLIAGAGDINLKLFYEKLDEANNYDFDQAIRNIENEFQLEKREEQRKVRKRIEFIHVIGIMGMICIIVILMVYLIMPWLRMYNMQQLGF